MTLVAPSWYLGRLCVACLAVVREVPLAVQPRQVHAVVTVGCHGWGHTRRRMA